MIIAPSLLSADFLNLKEEIERFNSIENIWLHLDIMDGHFVPNLTFGRTIVNNLPKITKHKLDAHFMVTNPEDYLEWFKDFPLHNFTFHWEATKHHDSLITSLKKHFPSVGVSLNPSTPVEVIPEYLLEKLDLILIMSVNPGFGGQGFIEGSVDKIKKLKELKNKNSYKYQIQVDGGINETTAKVVKLAGADNLVAGSYIFSEPTKQYINRINNLR